MTKPTHVNGHEIVLRRDTPTTKATRPGEVILVKRVHQHEPWVTAWRAENQTDGWWHGHYFADEELAKQDFFFRARRGY